MITEVRKTKEEEIGRVMEIYEAAREFMHTHGNPTQWQGGHPSRELIERDVTEGVSFVCVSENGEIHGVFAFLLGEDPTYRVIEEGAWHNDEPYGTIHRIAGDGQERGLLAAATAYASRFASNLRADTHRDNLPMQRALTKNGYRYCGVIRLADGSPRLAYQRTDDKIQERIQER